VFQYSIIQQIIKERSSFVALLDLIDPLYQVYELLYTTLAKIFYRTNYASGATNVIHNTLVPSGVPRLSDREGHGILLGTSVGTLGDLDTINNLENVFKFCHFCCLA
jgi:hypothetical protein